MLILKFSFVNCCKQQAIRCHIGHSVDSVGQWVLHSYSSVCLLIRYTLKVFLYCRQYCRKLSFQMQWCFSPCAYSLTYVIKVENNQWFWSSVLCHSFWNVFTENTWWLLKSVSYQYSDSSQSRKGLTRGQNVTGMRVNSCLSCCFISIPVLW